MVIAILPLPDGQVKIYRRETGDFDSIILEWELDKLKEEADANQDIGTDR